MALEVFGAIIAGFYGGYLSDKYGRKKVMVIAEAFRTLSLLLMSIAASPRFEIPIVIFFMMTISTICGGISNPAVQAMIIDVSTSENRKFIYTVQYWSMNGAFSIGGLLGGFLFSSHRFELFLLVTGISCAYLLVLLFYMTETFSPDIEVHNKKRRRVLTEMLINYKTVAKDSTFIIFTLATLLAMSIEFQARNYTAVRLAKEFPLQSYSMFNNWSLSVDGIRMFGIITAENSMLVVTLSFLITTIMKRFRDKFVLFVGILVNAVAFAILGISNLAWVLILAMVFATIGELMYWPVTQAFVAEIPPEKNRSSYMAVNALVVNGAVMLGSFSISLGAFLPSWIMGGAFLLTGVVSLLLFSIVLKSFKHRTSLTKNI